MGRSALLNKSFKTVEPGKAPRFEQSFLEDVDRRTDGRTAGLDRGELLPPLAAPRIVLI